MEDILIDDVVETATDLQPSGEAEDVTVAPQGDVMQEVASAETPAPTVAQLNPEGTTPVSTTTYQDDLAGLRKQITDLTAIVQGLNEITTTYGNDIKTLADNYKNQFFGQTETKSQDVKIEDLF